MISPHRFVTIVSGLPRSGTSMMMQMLQAGGLPVLADQSRPADEDNPQGYFEFDPVKRTKRDASWLATASGQAVKIVCLLLYDLPAEHEYRVLFMNRCMDEIMASQQVMLARRGTSGAGQSASEMGRIFEDQLNRIRDWLSRQAHIHALPLEYHRVLADPSGEANHIREFLGLNLDVLAMAKAVDPRLYLQRKR